MLPTSSMPRRLMLLGLLISAFGWGISFFFTFDTWDGAVARLHWMGAEPIAYQPLLGYWLKMAGAVFGCLGIASALAFRNPERYESVIRLLAPLHLFVGATLIVAAVTNGLTPNVHRAFLWDVAFCFTVAALVGLPLLRSDKAK